MRHAPFVHLRCQTEYSLLATTTRVKALVKRAAEYRLPALALTDQGNLFAAVQFYQAAFDAGIKPILGCQVYLAPGDRTEPPRTPADQPPELLLLARNMSGWRSLMALISAAHLESMFDRPQVDRALLAKHADGLICLTGGREGALPTRLADGDQDGAVELLRWLKTTYGNDNLYIEICENRADARRPVNLALIDLAHSTDTPLVATSESAYLNPEDARAHDAMLCIGQGKLMDEEDRLRLPEGEFHFRSPDDLLADFADLPDAIENTLHIARRCNLDFRFEDAHMPAFPVPEGVTPEEYLAEQVMTGIRQRMQQLGTPEEKQQTYIDRVQWELDTINRMGYPGYFLIVWDIMRYARDEHIPVGPGRGSAAGSLVAYALGITDLDPLPYNLLFERFLNPERVSLPDIDMDFCMDNRDRLIQYVAKAYGSDHVCQIITFGTMGAKAVLRDVARVLDFSFMESDRIAKLVPNTLGMTLPEALKEEPRLQQMVNDDSRVAELMDIALSLEGVARHASTHAAGVVISDAELTHHTPLYRGSNGEPVSHFAKDDAEAMGLVKFDFLGLKTLTVIDHAVQEVARRGISLEVSTLPLDEPTTYALLCKGDTTGVFQLESSGMRDLIVKMQPDCFEDLVALLALYRPGPIGSGMLDDFIGRKKGTTPITYDLPELEPILSETYGVIVYQEQVMRIANVVAGYSLGDADLLRRAMGKKKASEMEKQKQRFIAGATELGHKADIAERIFDLMAYFAGYGFNKSHSAAYAVISFQTAYLKAHHPVPFLASLLTNDMGNPDKTAKNIAETKDMKIRLLPPDVNQSQVRFVTETLPDAPADGPPTGPETLGIRYGLGGIKGVGEAALESIVAARKGGPYVDLFDLCRRIDLNKANKRVLEALIAAGACDAFGSRGVLAAELESAMQAGSQRAKERESGQVSIFGDDEPALMPTANGDRRALEWDPHETLVKEKEALGFYLSAHPMERHRAEAKRYGNAHLGNLQRRDEGREVRVVAILVAVRTRITKKGERMAFLMVEDEFGQAEVITFPDTFGPIADKLENDITLLITGTVEADDGGGRGPAKIKASKVELLSEVRQRQVRLVTLRFTSTGVTPADLVALRAMLEEHPGNCRVRLRVHVPGQVDATLAADDSLRVAADDQLVRRVERMLGRDSVAFA